MISRATVIERAGYLLKSGLLNKLQYQLCFSPTSKAVKNEATLLSHSARRNGLVKSFVQLSQDVLPALEAENGGKHSFHVASDV
jgi:hypothetical protein